LTPTIDPPEVDQPTEEQEAPQSDYGENNRELPKQLIEAIKAAVKEFQEQEKYTRRREVLHDRRNRFYERSYQHLSWNSQNGGFVLASPGASIVNSAGNSVQCPSYIDDYDIFGPYLWILIAILTQNTPGVNFQPIDPSQPDDIDKARAAEAYGHAFDRMNDIKEIQTEMVRMMALSGRVVSWTRTEQDAQRFGYEQDQITPKYFQRTTIYGTLETKVPILAKKFDRDCPYVLIYDDPDLKVAKSDYPWIADKIRANVAALGESMYERTARLGVLNGTRNQAQIGDSFTHLVSRVNAFLRPAAFTGDLYDNVLEKAGPGDTVAEQDENSQTQTRTMTVGEKLKQLFPDGCRAVFMGDEYAESFNCSLDDELDIRFPFPGDGMFRKAIMDPMVVVQDAFNDAVNAAREIFDTGWPSTWVDATEDEYAAITSQRAAPYAYRQKKAKSGIKLPDSFYREPNPELPATFVEFLEMLQSNLPQFMLSTPPALFGAQMEDQKTASGYAQARNQATGRLGLIWQSIQHMFARIRYQSALAASKNEQQTGQMIIPGGEGQQDINVDLDQLKKGNFGCYPDEDSSFPETTQQKRATLQGLITLAGTSPAMQQLLDNPDNIEEMKRLNGFDELVLLPAEARNKQLAEIEILLQQEPIPASPEEMQAAMVQHAAGAIAAKAQGTMEPQMMAPPMHPSVPVDELDYHQWEFEKCQEWLSSAARREEDKKGNQAGVQNVKLHALAHRAMLMQMQAAAAAAAPPPQPHPVAAKPAPAPPKGPPGATPGPSAPAAPPAIAA